MTTPQDATTIFFVGMGPAPSSPSTIIVVTPSTTTTNNSNNNQSAGPTAAGPVYTPAVSSLSTTSRKRKLAVAFGDNKQYRPTSWPGANAPAAAGPAAAAATATNAVAVAAAAAQEGFPLPKRRRVAGPGLLRRTPAASCFADVDEAARGGPLGFARLMAGLPGGFEGHRSRPLRNGPDGGSGVVSGVVRGLPGSGLPAVGPAAGLVFRMWPGREIRVGERGRRAGGVPAPLAWLVRERERRERVEREADEFLAGLEALQGGGREEDGEGEEDWERVGAWREETVAEGERMRREWERVRELVPNWAEALAAYR